MDTVNRVVPQLIKFGRVKKSALGIRLLETHGMHSRGIHGVVVAEVIKGSPADKAGIAPLSRLPDGSIQLGDVITGADGSPVADGNDLFRILDDKNPGEKLALELTNGGEVRTVTVKLGVLQQ